MKHAANLVALAATLTAIVHGSALAQDCTAPIVLGTQEDVNAFTCTVTTNSLQIGQGGSSDLIVDLSPLSVLTSVGGELFIYGNEALASLAGLQNLISVGGNLRFGRNTALSSLGGLENLLTIGGDLWIQARSPALSSLEGLDGLGSVGGDVQISFNDSLWSLAGLGSLSSVGGDLRINANPVLGSLQGLDSLTSVGGLYVCCRPSALASLAGLENLASVETRLNIQENPLLTSLDGLQGLSSVGRDVVIQDNPLLHDCGALAGLISDGTFSGVGDFVTIRDNAPEGACNAAEQVVGSVTGVEEIHGAEHPPSFALSPNYPNPFNPTTTIDFDLALQGAARLAVYDVLGREVALLASGEFPAGRYRVTWDATGYPSGVYTCRLHAGGSSIAQTLVLQK